uniref:Protein kinase domain-containing protein n=1 Tax=Populus davidiana TaxID=266767 RepID=A0A6M2EPF3_9ROSI
MNPKISDFGMARIFGVDQIEANTNRVVGTYGYMSPEYAMQGLFSVKSDVYSFGVLLLEVITGRKNSHFYDESNSSNLVGYVWDLWREGRALELVDTLMGDSYPEDQVLRCIQIGLLCVQESAMDRPSMSNVVFMLSNDTTLPMSDVVFTLSNDTTLLSPKQPAFIMKESYYSGDPLTSEGSHSINEVTSQATCVYSEGELQ